MTTATKAAEDLAAYGQAMIDDNTRKLERIEKAWDLWGYSPQVVSAVLHAVAGEATLEEALDRVLS